jgi:hypothetical protein
MLVQGDAHSVVREGCSLYQEALVSETFSIQPRSFYTCLFLLALKLSSENVLYRGQPAWISHNDDEIHYLGNTHARRTMLLVIVKLSQWVVVIAGKDNHSTLWQIS